MYLNLY